MAKDATFSTLGSALSTADLERINIKDVLVLANSSIQSCVGIPYDKDNVILIIVHLHTWQELRDTKGISLSINILTTNLSLTNMSFTSKTDIDPSQEIVYMNKIVGTHTMFNQVSYKLNIKDIATTAAISLHLQLHNLTEWMNYHCL